MPGRILFPYRSGPRLCERVQPPLPLARLPPRLPNATSRPPSQPTPGRRRSGAPPRSRALLRSVRRSPTTRSRRPGLRRPTGPTAARRRSTSDLGPSRSTKPDASPPARRGGPCVLECRYSKAERRSLKAHLFLSRIATVASCLLSLVVVAYPLQLIPNACYDSTRCDAGYSARIGPITRRAGFGLPLWTGRGWST